MVMSMSDPEKRFRENLENLREHADEYIKGQKKGFLGSKQMDNNDYLHSYKEIARDIDNLFVMWKRKLPEDVLGNKSYENFMARLPTIRDVLKNSNRDVNKMKNMLSKLLNEIPR